LTTQFNKLLRPVGSKKINPKKAGKKQEKSRKKAGKKQEKSRKNSS
jgi:hypothetical protein